MNEKTPYEAGLGSDALQHPQRVVFLTAKTSAKVKGDAGKQLMSYPHLLLREMIVFEVMLVVLVVIALFWDAPLEQLADPFLTPNPAKAPWYFLGLQELLHYFPPLVAGIVIPTLVILALVVIPYFNVNIQGEPLWAANRERRFLIFSVAFAVLIAFFGRFKAWTVLAPTVAVGLPLLVSYFARRRHRAAQFLRSRTLSWWVMTWFIAVALTLTVVGTFFRGPGWAWVWPWR